jgi:uncharacterized protein (TIGR02246 family)
VKYVLLLPPALALILALTGCQQPAPQAPDTRAADETAIRAAIDDQLKAYSAFDSAKVASFYTDDAVGMGPDAPVVQGKANIQKYFEDMLQAKPEISWKTAKVEVAKSGDLAYSWGTGKMTVKAQKGKATETTFKSASVWQKQLVGTWKMVVDTWSTDPPVKPPAKHAEPNVHKKTGRRKA